MAIQPQCRVRVFLDHFQLVQLTRLFSALSLFVEQLEADRKFFTGQVTNGDATPLALVAIIEQVILFRCNYFYVNIPFSFLFLAF